jgi:hypothetical protein
MLTTTTGNNIIAIHRRSYRIPIRKEGIRSANDNPFGLNAKKVTTLNRVNISRKIRKRLITHKMVFGIRYFNSIILIEGPDGKKTTKE